MSTLENRRFRFMIYKILIFFTFAVLFTWNVFFLSWGQTYSKLLVHYYAYQEGDSSCHINSQETDWLHFVNKNQATDLTPLDTRIFFHDTSCKGGLTSRQACAVESAARANPDWNIQVLFVGPIHAMFQKGSVYKALKDFENVDLSSINLKNYSKGTPIEFIFSTDMVKYLDMTETKTKHNVADLLKFLTLYKFGGVYMEMDFIVVNSFNDLAKNWVGKQLNDEIGIDAFGISNDVLGRMIANTTMLDISTNYNPFEHDRGLGILTRTLQKICSTKMTRNIFPNTCGGFEFYEHTYFYPVSREKAVTYLTGSDPDLGDTYTALAHRMWSELIDKYKIPQYSRLIKLARLMCPTVCDLYGDDFGVS